MCTLSWASARVCWIEPDLTTVSSRCVWPPGPVVVGRGRGAAAAVAGTALRPRGRRARRRHRPRGLAPRGPLEQVRGDLGCRSRSSTSSAGGPLAAAAGAPSTRPRSRRLAGASARARRAGGLAAAPSSSPGTGRPSALRRSLLRCRRCSGISAIFSSSSAYSGPEMPPSFRTRQKWTAMKITITNGNNSTWSTYHRSNVSLLISLDPRSTYLTDCSRTPACSPSCSCRR